MNRRSSKCIAIDKTIFEDPRISLEAKGMWCVYMCDPNPKMRKEDMDNQENILDELVKFGYAVKITKKNEQGKEEPEYEIFESQELSRCS